MNYEAKSAVKESPEFVGMAEQVGREVLERFNHEQRLEFLHRLHNVIRSYYEMQLEKSEASLKESHAMLDSFRNMESSLDQRPRPA